VTSFRPHTNDPAAAEPRGHRTDEPTPDAPPGTRWTNGRTLQLEPFSPDRCVHTTKVFDTWVCWNCPDPSADAADHERAERTRPPAALVEAARVWPDYV
jgi:hypothetical protein